LARGRFRLPQGLTTSPFDSHGEALDHVYEIEKQTLGRFEALARLVLDHRQLSETQNRDRGLDGEVQPADTERDAP
jgi:hypothetical protein